MISHNEVGYNFAKLHLNVDLFDYQKQIIGSILDRDLRKVTIRACTRSGKSYTTAIAAIAYACIYTNSRVGIIAPSKDKTKIIMNYILEMLSTSDLEEVIDLDVMGLTRLERLKREVSKTRITFKNLSSIQVLTADVKGKGFSVMGFSFDLTILDESAEIPEDVFAKIFRMLLENKKAKLVELGNPWFLNHFYEHSLDPTWTIIKIGYKTCIDQGRFSEEQVEEMRNEFIDVDFVVLLEAEFPKEITNSLFLYNDLKKAQREIPEPKETPEVILGIDVARMGADSTIIYLIHRFSSLFMVKDSWEFKKQKLTETAGDIIDIINKHTPKYLNMDSTGIGSGLDDMLQEYIDNNNLETVINSIVFSEKADDVHNLNRKADIFFNLSKVFKEGNIIIPKDDHSLFLQLRKMQFEIQSNGKKKVIDGQDKSPDRGDSLSIGCYVIDHGVYVNF